MLSPEAQAGWLHPLEGGESKADLEVVMVLVVVVSPRPTASFKAPNTPWLRVGLLSRSVPALEVSPVPRPTAFMTAPMTPVAPVVPVSGLS